MIALGELRLLGCIECELLCLFVRYITADDAGVRHHSRRIDAYLDDHFSFLIEGIGRAR